MIERITLNPTLKTAELLRSACLSYAHLLGMGEEYTLLSGFADEIEERLEQAQDANHEEASEKALKDAIATGNGQAGTTNLGSGV